MSLHVRNEPIAYWKTSVKKVNHAMFKLDFPAFTISWGYLPHTKPTDWTELLRKYTLESVAKAFEKELLAEGFPIKQGELLPEMKKILRK